MSSWKQISELLQLTARLLKAEWKSDLPPFDTLPSETLELACDAWCLALAKNVTAPIYPSEEVRPWVLARLVSMAVSARELEQNGKIPPAEINPANDETVFDWRMAWRASPALGTLCDFGR
jgi:hypothetical protein